MQFDNSIAQVLAFSTPRYLEGRSRPFTQVPQCRVQAHLSIYLLRNKSIHKRPNASKSYFCFSAQLNSDLSFQSDSFLFIHKQESSLNLQRLTGCGSIPNLNRNQNRLSILLSDKPRSFFFLILLLFVSCLMSQQHGECILIQLLSLKVIGL